jgi:hypothetical protein
MEKTRIQINYKPNPKQEQLHYLCQTDSPYYYITVVASRQSGKSTALQFQVVTWAQENPNSVVWVVCPSEVQAKENYNDIMNVIGGSPLVANTTGSKGQQIIYFPNKSTIHFKSSLQEYTLKGASCDFVALDEAAIIKENTLEEMILPTLSVKGKKVLIASTPKGLNWFHRYYLNGLDKSQKDFASVKMHYTDNPHINLKLLKSIRKNINANVWNQEYENAFIDGGSLFGNIKACSTSTVIESPVASDQYYSAIDCGLITDYTVITTCNQKAEVVHIDRFRGLKAHRVTSPMLFGVRVEGSLGGRNELQDAFELFYNTVIEPSCDMITQTFNRILKINGYSTTVDIKSLQPLKQIFSEQTMLQIADETELRPMVDLPAERPSKQAPMMSGSTGTTGVLPQ